jgi:hypothetical protein
MLRAGDCRRRPRTPWSNKCAGQPMSWAREELNLRPLPCQQNARNRCAEGRSCRSPPSVGAEVKCSLGVQLTLAVAPSCRACSTLASWASDSRGAGPLSPLLRSPSVPLACQRQCQTLTAWAETPSWRATSAWRTPAANNSAARSRRAWSRSRSRYAAARRGTVGMAAILTRHAAQLQPGPRPQPDTQVPFKEVRSFR